MSGLIHLVPESVVKNVLLNDNYDQFNNINNTNNNVRRNKNDILVSIILFLVNILNFIIFIYAIFLSFKRNKGFNLGSFLSACCCSICYILYAFANPL